MRPPWIREVRALLGFTRVESNADFAEATVIVDGRLTKLSRESPKWLPAFLAAMALAPANQSGLFFVMWKLAFSGYFRPPLCGGPSDAEERFRQSDRTRYDLACSSPI